MRNRAACHHAQKTAAHRLTQSRFDRDGLRVRRRQWHAVAFNGCAIHFKRNQIALSGPTYLDVITHASELPAGPKTRPAFGDDRFDQQSVVVGADAEYPLRYGVVVPSRGPGKP